ncbi:hypothetical protein Y032_0074g899 [Ancylostoma ceylanicum]|uniref:Uncharacterized protein n=1 Tax=Ancylostoma ceylanicum TaxID=53326 RepID=A0A016TUT2_9BILA|nr:hypothetical protein Y032_0074g899 [Ancylostoma ceylanicum]
MKITMKRDTQIRDGDVECWQTGFLIPLITAGSTVILINKQLACSTASNITSTQCSCGFHGIPCLPYTYCNLTKMGLRYKMSTISAAERVEQCPVTKFLWRGTMSLYRTLLIFSWNYSPAPTRRTSMVKGSYYYEMKLFPKTNESFKLEFDHSSVSAQFDHFCLVVFV